MKSNQKKGLPAMPELPVDVIIEILCRLPVKSLLRFRCLSRQFRSIIDSRDFINRHLQNHPADQRLIAFGSLSRRLADLFSVDFDSANNVLKLEHPFESWGDEYILIGSCNGLLAMSHRGGTSVGLWNISTKKRQILPKFWTDFDFPVRNPTFYGYIFDGFGYDATGDDYKWVRVIHFNRKNFTEATVYSLKTNSWGRIEDLPPYYYNYFGNELAVLVGGALNWLVGVVVDGMGKRSFLSFDLKGEKFCLVSVPDIVDDFYRFEVVVFGGCLCLGCFYVSKEALDIWVMKEYGVKESWTKLFSFNEESPLGCVGFSNCIRALAYSKCGDQVLFYQIDGKVFGYDLEKEKGKNIEINDWPTFIPRMTIYVDSLVSPVISM